jgi:hypothetical protein
MIRRQQLPTGGSAYEFRNLVAKSKLRCDLEIMDGVAAWVVSVTRPGQLVSVPTNFIGIVQREMSTGTRADLEA